MLKEIIDGMPMAGVMLDRKGVIEHCNDNLLDMTGWRSEEVTGSCWFETFVPVRQRIERKSEYQEAMMSGVPRSRHRSEILSRDGREIGILWNGTVLRDGKGVVRGFVKLGLNLEEIPRPDDGEPDFMKYERIGRAVAGSAHDLNNLLLPVINYSQIILDQVPAGSDLYEFARNISLAGKRGKLLAKQMLSSIRGMDAAVKLEELDIAEVVVEFSELIRSMLGNNVSLKTDVSSCIATIFGDRDRLEQMLLNLALNARDAMPEGGEMSIRLMEVCFESAAACHGAGIAPGAYVLLSFSDSGHGMGKEVLDHIFEAFFTTKEKGSGIGLANVQDIARKHGAYIQVSSAPGAGTTFRIYFPKTDHANSHIKGGGQMNELIVLVFLGGLLF